MHTVVYAPFVLSAAVVVLSHVGINRLAPRTAAWAISTATVALAVSSVGALVLLAAPLPARVPFIATLGRWQPQSVAADTPVPLALSVLALLALLLLAERAVGELRRLVCELAELSGAHTELALCGTSEVVVVSAPEPHAHAMSRTVTRPGRVIVTTAMLDLLDHEERAAVIAHERAHLRHGHAAFLASARLSSALNPLLIPLRRDLAFSLERWADEDAAVVTDPTVIASALAKAALALGNLTDTCAGATALHLHTHAVARRVAALLEDPPPRSRLSWALFGLAAVATASLAWAMHDTERFFEAARLWHRR